ncbi:hypothetical protein GMST_30820 [Geomonas silvestris]|uniref:Translocation and assembly module TamB C-terminal domain-containing protein n=1 Tax=Geomonas silvestris TaxID=2740184 RepID=A0A6V8MLM1_9BACT|nr:translocation/assembly module TamB domain-containing protein [Geomonas silvestris]GFO60757.1 hypothetical protein GMST_30820 [Geomonas silvestris]
MKRLALYLPLAVLLALVTLAVGFAWLVGTGSGARFALETGAGAAGYRVSAQKVEGRLWDRLHLVGVALAKPKLSVEVRELDLVWQPQELFNWRLAVSRLALSGVTVQDDLPPSTKAPLLSWPRLSGMTRRLSGRVERLELARVSYRKLAQDPVLVERAAASLDYREGELGVTGLVVKLPQGRATGELAAGFFAPRLKIDLALVPQAPLNGMDSFALQARLSGGRGPELLAGSFAAAGKSRGRQRLELSGGLAVTQHAFLLRDLRLVRPGERGTLGGTGSLTLTAGAPLIALDLNARDLDLNEYLHRPTRLSGTLFFSGTSQRYRGSFDLKNRGPGWQSAALAARYQGTATTLRLSRIAAQALDGALSGNLDLDWLKEFTVRGRLAGRGLNPARLAPDWSGEVNLDLAADLVFPKKGAPHGRVNGRLLESRLHGQELQGELAAAFAGERLRVDRLLLAGRGFELKGSGELDQRLDLSARVNDLSRLVPNSAGSLNADAWVRWRDRRLSGSATGTGGGLAVAGIRAAQLSFAALLGEAPAYPLQLSAELTGVAVGGFSAQNARLLLDGTLARHTLAAQLAGPLASAQLALSGGYQAGTWSATLSEFSGRDQVGPWQLAAPARLTIDAERLSVSPLVLNGLPQERLELSGELNLKASTGTLAGDFSRLNLARANAWLTGGELSGASSGNLKLTLLPGRRVAVSARLEAAGSVTANKKTLGIERLSASLEGGAAGSHATVDLALSGGQGTAYAVFDTRVPAALALPDQGELSLRVSQLDLALAAPFLPQGVQVTGRLAGVTSGRLRPGARLDLKGNLALSDGRGSWISGDDSLAAQLQKFEVNFGWRAAKGAPGRLQLAGAAEANGVYQSQGRQLAFERLALRLDADDKGTRASVNLALEGGAALRGSLSSNSPASLALPETGEFALAWGGLKPELLKPWLPGSVNITGLLSGEARGRLLPGRRLEVSGAGEFSSGTAGWQGSATQLTAKLRSASLNFDWRGESFTGNLDLSLAQYGSAQGRLALPIPARLPVTPNPSGLLKGSLNGRLREQGLLTSLFPGLAQETHGDLEVALALAGTWGSPNLTGGVTLANAGAYLPSAGIRVEELGLKAALGNDEVRIEGITAKSGPGRLEGNALLRLKGWQLASYSAVLSGERFQTVYLPELQLLTSPHLRIEGEGTRVAIRGDIVVPEMLISGPPTRSAVGTSPDVVLEGAPAETAAAGKKFPLEVEGEIRLALGNKVQVKAEGIDATLGGEMNLALSGLERITSRGEIRVVKGRYRAYGIDLDIVRGRLYYVNDPVERPTLDILALRTVADVKAGVTVAGPLGSQVVKLYSEPALPDVDIMAYMVLGHPLGAGSGDQASLVAGAASSLLSLGQSESLQEQIKDRLGLSVLGLQTVDQASAGRMGYKEISVTPSGLAPRTQTTGESLLTVGKYLTPKLYLSYGRSLVTGGNLFQLRYDIFRHWQIETQSGSESGADIYYKVEFD